ncbi:Dual 3',5'-cyclic-AMP and -GMP phosphodiesterase 11 [Halotydeus destructor]|nr:Dual 3',5'-cyclic-AMP and -GMP phosphodiesterase 11 [Halotydeus destructor]
MFRSCLRIAKLEPIRSESSMSSEEAQNQDEGASRAQLCKRSPLKRSVHSSCGPNPDPGRPVTPRLSGRSLTLPPSSSRDGCPTIAAALWRPLWPPGWHPRGGTSSPPTEGPLAEEEAEVVPSHSRAPVCRVPLSPSQASSSSTKSSRPKFFLQKYYKHNQKVPIIVMSEPTDEGDSNDTESASISGSSRMRKKNKCRTTSIEMLNTKDRVSGPEASSISAPSRPITPIEEHERMEAWLDEHPAFLRNYFIRKASRSLVDAWLLAHTVPQSAGAGSASGFNCSSSVSAPTSGAATPVRKISATEFEKGALFLRPMVSTTIDGTPTFLPIPPQEGGTAPESPITPPRKSRKELEALDEKQLIFELVKDICNDLDVKSLCHKILQNVSILTNADKCSLFLVKGDKSDPNRHFVSTLFDVSCESTIEQMERAESIVVPWGTGIVGYVASTGQSVHIPDCYADERFSDQVDQKTGYKTRNMLCSPIFDICGQVMGVAQVINKKPRLGPQASIDDYGSGDHFGSRDQEIFDHYLQFCGIGLRNAQLFERSQLENKRNQVLLDLARMVFEEQSTLEHVVYRIMVHIQSLLEVERCQVLLVAHHDLEHSSEHLEIAQRSTSFSRVFDLESCDLKSQDDDQSGSNQASATTERQSPFEGRFPINVGITGFVAGTGQTLNVTDAYCDSRFDQSVDVNSSRNFRHRSILCMPIRNAQRKIIGVSQLINKMSGVPFNKNDENLFEAFAIFVGLGIQNVQMYEKVVKAMAKQRVTFEVLSYHATAPAEEAQHLARQIIPSTQAMRLNDLQFSDFSLDEDMMIKACLRMFLDLDLIERFQIDYLVVCRWLLSVRKNYRPVTYHNWRHAFNVAQMMFAILTQTGLVRVLGEIETLALLVACLSHDLDHRGTNNSFQVKSCSPLAQLYSTSVMERHHFDQCLMILNSNGNQVFGTLSPDEYQVAVHVLEEAILATDLAVYFDQRDTFFTVINSQDYVQLFGQTVSSDGQVVRNPDPQSRSLLRGMLMTACDIAAITKPWEVQRVVAQLVASEFFQQGDIERDELKMEPAEMMDRNKKDELPKMQVSFIDAICAPIYEAFWKLYPDILRPLYDGVQSNRFEWIKLAQEQDKLKDWADKESQRLVAESEKRKQAARKALKLRQHTTS